MGCEKFALRWKIKKKTKKNSAIVTFVLAIYCIVLLFLISLATRGGVPSPETLALVFYLPMLIISSVVLQSFLYQFLSFFKRSQLLPYQMTPGTNTGYHRLTDRWTMKVEASRYWLYIFQLNRETKISSQW